MKREGPDLWEGILRFSPLLVETCNFHFLKIKCHPTDINIKDDCCTFMKLLKFVVSANEEGEGEQIYEEQTNHSPAPGPAPLVFADPTLRL